MIINAVFLVCFIAGLAVFACTMIVYKKAHDNEDASAMMRTRIPLAVGSIFMKLGIAGTIICFLGALVVRFLPVN